LRSRINTPYSFISRQRTAATPNLVARQRSNAPGAPRLSGFSVLPVFVLNARRIEHGR
jgi:hypothetical protein